MGQGVKGSNASGSAFRYDDFVQAVIQTLTKLSLGLNVLVHSVRGKHRSGAFVCFIKALIKKKGLGDTLKQYFESDLEAHDHELLERVHQMVT